MKTTNALMAAALAGVFAAGTTVSQAITGAPVTEEKKEKEDCPAKDKDKCPAKDKKKEGTVTAEKKEKEDCPGKDKDKDKDKDKCPSKDKEKDKKEGTIL